MKWRCMKKWKYGWTLAATLLHTGKQFEHLQHGHKDKTPAAAAANTFTPITWKQIVTPVKPKYQNQAALWLIISVLYKWWLKQNITTLDFYYSCLATYLSWYYSITRGCDSSVNTMTGLHAIQAMNWSQNINKNFWHFSVNERWDRPV